MLILITSIASVVCVLEITSRDCQLTLERWIAAHILNVMQNGELGNGQRSEEKALK